MPMLGQLAVTIDYREGTIRLEYKKPLAQLPADAGLAIGLLPIRH
jgi:hypothetical protein